MKSIGGYLELELKKNEEYHKEALRLNSGRNALEYILKSNTYTNEDYTNEDYTLIDLLPKKEETTMKSELKNFLKKQHNSNNSSSINSTSISALDSMMMSNSYSYSEFNK